MVTQRLMFLAAASAVCLVDVSVYDQALAADRQVAQVDAPLKKDKVNAEAHLSLEKLAPGKECRILIRLNVLPGWHINSNPARPEGYVPTEVSFKGKHGTTLAELSYPKGKLMRMADSDDPISVYDGKVDLFGKLTVPEAAAGLTEDMEIVVKYQACDDRTCLLPTTVKLSGKLPVAKRDEVVRPINQKLFQPTER